MSTHCTHFIKKFITNSLSVSYKMEKSSTQSTHLSPLNKVDSKDVYQIA